MSQTSPLIRFGVSSLTTRIFSGRIAMNALVPGAASRSWLTVTVPASGVSSVTTPPEQETMVASRMLMSPMKSAT